MRLRFDIPELGGTREERRERGNVGIPNEFRPQEIKFRNITYKDSPENLIFQWLAWLLGSPPIRIFAWAKKSRGKWEAGELWHKEEMNPRLGREFFLLVLFRLSVSPSESASNHH